MEYPFLTTLELSPLFGATPGFLDHDNRIIRGVVLNVHKRIISIYRLDLLHPDHHDEFLSAAQHWWEENTNLPIVFVEKGFDEKYESVLYSFHEKDITTITGPLYSLTDNFSNETPKKYKLKPDGTLRVPMPQRVLRAYQRTKARTPLGLDPNTHRLIVEMLEAGRSGYAIIKSLNDRELRSLKGGIWCRRTLRRYLVREGLVNTQTLMRI